MRESIRGDFQTRGHGMKIVELTAREIFNSRGMPTIECEIVLENGKSVTASVPTGVSCGEGEAVELRDGGSRLEGKGVLKAVEIIQTVIAPLLIGRAPHVITMDELIRELDGTENKSKLGANTLLAVSVAVCKAQAMADDVELYELIAYLCGYELVGIPYPMFNVINGGAHASNNLQIQEFMIMPVGIPTFHAAMDVAATFYQTLKEILLQEGKDVAVGDEGGFAPDFKNDIQALDYLMEARELVQVDNGGSIMIALDVAASQFYNKRTREYSWQGKSCSASEMIEWYKNIVSEYPIYALEDGLSEHDWEGWEELTLELGSKIQIVGDDIFVTNLERIRDSIEQDVANTVLIKPNQVGTVTETLQAIILSKEYDRNVIVSHRSGETNDSFIADLAVGTSAGQIKAGGLSRGERMAKYNRLLQIETQLLGEE